MNATATPVTAAERRARMERDVGRANDLLLRLAFHALKCGAPAEQLGALTGGRLIVAAGDGAALWRAIELDWHQQHVATQLQWSPCGDALDLALRRNQHLTLPHFDALGGQPRALMWYLIVLQNLLRVGPQDLACTLSALDHAVLLQANMIDFWRLAIVPSFALQFTPQQGQLLA